MKRLGKLTQHTFIDDEEDTLEPELDTFKRASKEVTTIKTSDKVRNHKTKSTPSVYKDSY